MQKSQTPLVALHIVGAFVMNTDNIQRAELTARLTPTLAAPNMPSLVAARHCNDDDRLHCTTATAAAA